MKPTIKSFTAPECYDRIGEILNESDNSFPEVSSIPDGNVLTYTNGYYVKCTALFVDIRGSSELPKMHKRPRLAKIYRVYISEMVAVMNANDDCAEIRIVGDCVSGIFNTPKREDVQGVFTTGGRLGSTIDIINYRFQKAGIPEIKVGIGMAWGTALMIKAGYKGSGINDIVWMGDVVNEASNLCGVANSTSSDCEFLVSVNAHYNLRDEQKGLLTLNKARNCYQGNIINSDLNNWLLTKTKSANFP